MTLSACIPKDKFDAESAATGFPALNPILPELLIWLQDLNWPVTRDLAPLLAQADAEIVSPMKSIFAEDDLRRFAEHPTPEQKLEALDEIALATLSARRI